MYLVVCGIADFHILFFNYYIVMCTTNSCGPINVSLSLCILTLDYCENCVIYLQAHCLTCRSLYLKDGFCKTKTAWNFVVIVKHLLIFLFVESNETEVDTNMDMALRKEQFGKPLRITKTTRF